MNSRALKRDPVQFGNASRRLAFGMAGGTQNTGKQYYQSGRQSVAPHGPCMKKARHRRMFRLRFGDLMVQPGYEPG